MIMTSLLLSSPDDVLIAILVKLDVKDLLSVLQTCRALYVFCTSSDYIWHNIKINFPLNLPSQVITSISAAELRKRCVEGLRVDHNWCRNPPNLKSLSRIEHGGITDQIQFLPPQWLVTMSRVSTSVGPTSSILSIWDCKASGEAKRIERILLEPRGLSKFSATISEDGAHVLVVIFGNARAEIVRVYYIPLQYNDYRAEPDQYILSRVIADDVADTVFEADICGEIVSCLVARFEMGQPVYQVLFLNARSGKHRKIDVHTLTPFTQLQIHLFPDSFLLLSGIQNIHNLVLQIYNVTSFLWTLKSSANNPFASTSLGTPCAEYTSSTLGARHQEYKLSTGQRSTVAALCFPTGTNNRLVRFPIHSDNNGVTRLGPQSRLQTYTFHGAENIAMSPEFIVLGHCGQRGVWLEHEWDEQSDRTSFNPMKGVFSSDQSKAVNVGPLLPRHMALPFRTNTCQSIAFDEATGRVFLALYTGEIHVLNF